MYMCTKLYLIHIYVLSRTNIYQEQDVGGGPRDSNNKQNFAPQLKKD